MFIIGAIIGALTGLSFTILLTVKMIKDSIDEGDSAGVIKDFGSLHKIFPYEDPKDQKADSEGVRARLILEDRCNEAIDQYALATGVSDHPAER